MNINKKMDGDTLTVNISGRVDTTTAPELEQSLKESMADCKTLVIDFTDVEYISSAGLRTLLVAQKTMNKKGRMVLTHVNEVIMEIFDVTGFSDILEIE